MLFNEFWLATKNIHFTLICDFYNVVDKYLVKKLDIEYAPTRNVAPPYSKDEFVFSGMDPKDIKNPETRKQYEKLIEENTQKSKIRNEQAKIRRVENTFSARLFELIKNKYSSPEDSMAFSKIINLSINDDDRKKDLLKEVNKYIKNK